MHGRPPQPARRRFLKRSFAGGVLGLGVYAFGIEPRWLEVTSHEIQIPGLDSRLDGATAVHFSDTHIGSRVGDDYIRRQLNYISSLQPDFVFFTGDFLDCASDWHREKGRQMLPSFPKGKIGTACVFGNHDYLDSDRHDRKIVSGEVTRSLQEDFAEHDIKILIDETVEFDGLRIAGLRDYWYGGFNNRSAAKAIAKVSDGPSIVLSHNPDTADLPIWKNYNSWVLSGHTHGGQCTFPLLGAPILPVKNKDYVSGKYEIEAGHRMFINRGIGHTHRVRFMARPEITVLTLRSS